MIQGKTETLVGNCCIPILVWVAVCELLVIIDVDLVGILGRTGFDQVFVILVVFIAIDCLQVSLCEGYGIQFAILKHLEGIVRGFYHLYGHCVKQFGRRIPV